VSLPKSPYLDRERHKSEIGDYTANWIGSWYPLQGGLDMPEMRLEERPE
jgi:hypothetical protein